jgi:hypothetical protein
MRHKPSLFLKVSDLAYGIPSNCQTDGCSFHLVSKAPIYQLRRIIPAQGVDWAVWTDFTKIDPPVGSKPMRQPGDCY